MKERNFVAKYNWQVNKAKTHKDRKKASKRGYLKYKVDYKKSPDHGVLFSLSFEYN